MATQYEPVKLATIKQGEFIEACQKAFDEAQHVLIKHVEKHGITATAVMNAKVEIKYDATHERYGIQSEVDVKPPKKPVQIQVTTAFINDDPESGEPCLFSPIGGSATGNARQSIMQDSEEKPIAT